MGRVTVKFKRLRPEVILPEFNFPEDAGFDLRANLDRKALLSLNKNNCSISNLIDDDGAIVLRSLRIPPAIRLIIPTGLKVELSSKSKSVMKIYPRSGASIDLGLTLINSVGIIDQNYRGEIGIPVINLSSDNLFIEEGQRIAQAIIEELPDIKIVEVEEISETNRGEGGFGSTGF